MLVEPYWKRHETTGGLGDISVRLRTKLLGDPKKLFYLALGLGVKFASSAEFDTTHNLPISPGSTDIFGGLYNAIKIGRFTLPIALTYSHTGRYQTNLPIGEIITHHIGMVVNSHQLADLNLNLRGYEITSESNQADTLKKLSSSIRDKIDETSPQGISKTTAELSLNFKIPEIQTVLSVGIITDLKGKKTYKDNFSSIFSMQIGF